MRYILATILLFFGLVTATAQEMPQRPEIIVRNGWVIIKKDQGGAMADYLIRYADWARTNIKMAIAGECTSACTLFFGFMPPERICVTPEAKMGIHRSNRPEGTMLLMRMYPLPIIAWITSEGITEDIKYVPEELLAAMFQPCPENLMAPIGEKVD